jgi:hypothetical protein
MLDTVVPVRKFSGNCAARKVEEVAGRWPHRPQEKLLNGLTIAIEEEKSRPN